MERRMTPRLFFTALGFIIADLSGVDAFASPGFKGAPNALPALHRDRRLRPPQELGQHRDRRVTRKASACGSFG